jgi:hypothetical protein
MVSAASSHATPGGHCGATGSIGTRTVAAAENEIPCFKGTATNDAGASPAPGGQLGRSPTPGSPDGRPDRVTARVTHFFPCPVYSRHPLRPVVVSRRSPDAPHSSLRQHLAATAAAMQVSGRQLQAGAPARALRPARKRGASGSVPPPCACDAGDRADPGCALGQATRPWRQRGLSPGRQPRSRTAITHPGGACAAMQARASSPGRQLGA